MSNLRVILPCAPHDVTFLKRSLPSVAESLTDLFMRKSRIAHGAIVQVIFDGEVGSPEKIFDEVRSTSEVQFQWEMFKKGHGAAVARNFALAYAASDDYITFMDADDVVFPWCYWTRLKAWADAEQDGIAEPFVYTQCMYVYSDPTTKKVLKSVRDVPVAQNVRGWLEQTNVVLTTSVLTRARLLQEAGGFELDMICGEDGCLWRRAVGLNGRGTPVPIPLVTHLYNMRPESQCHRLYKAHEKMFHLEVSKHGPMGQALDDAAALRGMSARDAANTDTPIYNRVMALCGTCPVPVVSEDPVKFVASETLRSLGIPK